MPATIFQPNQDRLPLLLEDLASAFMSLSEIAQHHNTTLEALTLYLTSSDTLERIATTELAGAVRIRLAAQAFLPRAISALDLMLQGYAADAQKIAFEPRPSSVPIMEQQRQNARRACHLLYRLANYTPRPLGPLALARLAAPHAGEGYVSCSSTSPHLPEALPPAPPSIQTPTGTTDGCETTPAGSPSQTGAVPQIVSVAPPAQRDHEVRISHGTESMAARSPRASSSHSAKTFSRDTPAILRSGASGRSGFS